MVCQYLNPHEPVATVSRHSSHTRRAVSQSHATYLANEKRLGTKERKEYMQSDSVVECALPGWERPKI